uniref:Uncharacterized protein n=1 Tax=Toxoplasma gondii (strain ATCC 50861 / VEG) TaxID=432359 RepID=A0A0F7UYY8_TOXGV|nr:TPA: hypothetical protein BN1205_072890 [Toxoplasma gondii VEG]
MKTLRSAGRCASPGVVSASSSTCFGDVWQNSPSDEQRSVSCFLSIDSFPKFLSPAQSPAVCPAQRWRRRDLAGGRGGGASGIRQMTLPGIQKLFAMPLSALALPERKEFPGADRRNSTSSDELRPARTQRLSVEIPLLMATFHVDRRATQTRSTAGSSDCQQE